jgi:hypothetical protein
VAINFFKNYNYTFPCFYHRKKLIFEKLDCHLQNIFIWTEKNDILNILLFTTKNTVYEIKITIYILREKKIVEFFLLLKKTYI